MSGRRRRSIRLGVAGFVMKDARPQELVETIEAVAAGLVTSSLFTEVRDDEDAADTFNARVHSTGC